MKLKRPSTGLVIVAVALAALVVFAARGAVMAWRLAGPTRMSVHGYVAMAIAAVGTLLLGGGLMWLAFYSSRAGFDDDVDDQHG